MLLYKNNFFGIYLLKNLLQYTIDMMRKVELYEEKIIILLINKFNFYQQKIQKLLLL